MPRRNRPRERYEPLDLTPESNPYLPKHLQVTGDSRPKIPDETRSERESREHDERERQRNARINRGIDWSICLVPGCGLGLGFSRREPPNPPDERDHNAELPLCDRHLGTAARQAAWRKDDPVLVAAVADVIERREAREKTQREAAKKAWLTKVDGHIYYVRLNGLIKVGWSRDIHDRLRSYGPSVQVLVVYRGTRDDETNLHRQLKPARARGHEWYEDGQILADFIAAELKRYGPPAQSYDSWTRPTRIVAGKRHRSSA